MTNMDFGLFEDSYKSYCPGSNDKHSFETPENSPQNHIAAVYMTNAAFRILMISAACYHSDGKAALWSPYPSTG